MSNSIKLERSFNKKGEIQQDAYEAERISTL